MSGASIKEVARTAGVSVGTVSNVLNRPEIVAEHTRDRVLAAIRELGFVRNESARTLRAGRSRTIALVIPDAGNPFFTDVARGADEAAEDAGALVVMCSSAGDPTREQRQLELLAQQRVLGLLLTPATQASTSYLNRLVENGTRVVLVDRGAGAQDRCSVAVDDVLGGRLAGEHLVERGHQRVAYVGGPLTTHHVADRHDGLREALARAGCEDPLLIETPSTHMSVAREAVARLMDVPARRRPTAVFCVNDIVAVGVLQGLTRLGVRTPEDMAIVGYDDIAFAEAAAVPLSSLRQPREQLGRAAVELLLEESSGEPHEHRQVVFEPELVVRESSKRRPRRPRA